MTLTAIYNALFARYGNLNWWPARTPYEVIIGAVLTQNTAWRNVEKAIARFDEDLVRWNNDSEPCTLRGVSTVLRGVCANLPRKRRKAALSYSTFAIP